MSFKYFYLLLHTFSQLKFTSGHSIEINLRIFYLSQPKMLSISTFYAFQEMNLFKEFQSACEQSARCVKMNNESIQWKNCVNECVSPTCYKEIYEFDEVN